MKRIIVSLILIVAAAVAVQAKTLVVYYSYTNNVNSVVAELVRQIDADVIRVQPAEKGLDYAANNYAIGSAQIAAIRNNPHDSSSYPPIDPVDIDFGGYDFIIIGAPLWWSNMAAPLQTFLFNYGPAMAGKKIGLIVSSASSGISGVEADAKRLIPDGDFISPSLWIRSARTSDAASLLSSWLKTIKFTELTYLDSTYPDQNLANYTIFTVDGRIIDRKALSFQNLEKGMYIINGKKYYLND
ncbi:MAG: flavodoxin [Muribaculaceae bacterium]|nr:flavodoxin [Muribaculaceae bacterium]